MDKHGSLLTTCFLSGTVIGAVLVFFIHRMMTLDTDYETGLYSCRHIDCFILPQTPVLFLVLLTTGFIGAILIVLLARHLARLFFIEKKT